MSAKALDTSRAIARKATDALGGFGIFGVELFIKGDEVWFFEVSPRPHDTGLVTLVSQHLSEFALHARAILGLPVDTSLRTPGGGKPEAFKKRRMSVALARANETDTARVLAKRAAALVKPVAG